MEWLSRGGGVRCGKAALTAAGVLALVLFASGCGRRGRAPAAVSQISVAGSTSVTPFAEQLAESFMSRHPGLHVNVQGIGSSAGIQATESGAADVGMSSRPLRSEEAEQLLAVPMALDALAIIVHPSNPVRNLTRAQIRDIFAGRIVRWSTVGGLDRPVILVNREAGSGTRGAFEELVMGEDKAHLSFRAIRQGSNGAVRAVVESNPDAIGYISLGVVSPRVRVLAVDGVLPTPENVTRGRYRLVRPFLFVLRRGSPPSPLAREYLEYVLSDEGQRRLAQAGLVATPSRALPWKL
ncbi:MAG: phosphate ABC transporter substrate-binding protein [Armatimonadota bacterium]|nr:phosphate ABC transporter substrate-binding protein [Armatimonadota bacterium]